MMDNFLVNNQITSNEVLLITKDGKQLGRMCLKKAIQIAEMENLDLVQVNNEIFPPVVKLMNYKKFVASRSKINNEIFFKNRKFKVKNIKFHIFIGKNDFETKVKSISNFLKKGFSVRIIIVFRDSEIIRREIGYNLLLSILDLVSLEGKKRYQSKLEGNELSLIIDPILKL